MCFDPRLTCRIVLKRRLRMLRVENFDERSDRNNIKDSRLFRLRISITICTILENTQKHHL